MERNLWQTKKGTDIFHLFNPFVPNPPFLYSLKTSENLTVYGYFQGVEKGSFGSKWVKSKELQNHISEAHSEPRQTSNMETFAKLVNG